MNILDLIPKGHENAVRRSYLADLYMNHYGISRKSADRKMRNDLSDATDEGHIFYCKDGYFRYKDESDLPYCESSNRKESAKAWTLVNKTQKQARFLKRVKKGIQVEDGQLSLFPEIGGD